MQEARRTHWLAACRAVLEQRPEGEEGLFSTLWGQPALPLRQTPGRLLNLSLRVRAHSAAAWGPRAAAPCASLWWLHFPPGFQPRPCLLLCHPLVSASVSVSMRFAALLSTHTICLSVCLSVMTSASDSVSWSFFPLLVLSPAVPLRTEAAQV